jgi:hypothetical protein
MSHSVAPTVQRWREDTVVLLGFGGRVRSGPMLSGRHSTFSIGSSARRQATNPAATSTAPLQRVAFDRTSCWQRWIVAFRFEDVTRKRHGNRGGV